MAIEITAGYAEQDRDHVAALYWEAFSDKLGHVLAPDATGRAFFARILDPAHALVARDETGAILGVAGLRTDRGGFVGGQLSDITPFYGLFGGVWRGVLLLLLLRSVGPGQLYVDGLFVTAAARGQGVGALLLSAVADEARRRCTGRVTLDVIDRNTRARALYEREGFRVVGRRRIGPLRLAFGYRHSVFMERRL
jgi:ribosomal protein S18 acetylase RimI-like enzyme